MKGEKTLTITAASRIFVIMPCPTYAAALFENHKVMAFVALDEIDRHAHPYYRQFIFVSEVSLAYLPDIPAPIMTTAALV
jgi:hypothetical protein